MTEVNAQIAQKVLDTIDAGLVSGVGVPVPGQMCVEAAVCYALGLPHGDNPVTCVANSLIQLKIGINDASWSSDVARAKGLRRIGLAQLGSAGVLDELEFMKRVVIMTINTTVADAIQSVGLEDEANACRQAKDLTSAVRAAQRADSAAFAADRAAASVLKCDALPVARAAASAAASAAAHAADAADRAAASVLKCDAFPVASAAASAADKILSDYAERVVQILIDMKAPGTQWLYLTEGEST